MSCKIRNLATVKQFTSLNPAFSEGGMRWMIFQAKTSGLESALVRIGRRVLIDVDAFFEWVKSQNRSR
jgi:hypothetical protein